MFLRVWVVVLFACRNMRLVIPIPRAQSCMNGSLRGKSQSHSKRMAARALKIVFALLWFFWICFLCVCGRFTATRRPKIQLGALGGTFQSEFRQIQNHHNPDVSFPEKKNIRAKHCQSHVFFVVFCCPEIGSQLLLPHGRTALGASSLDAAWISGRPIRIVIVKPSRNGSKWIKMGHTVSILLNSGQLRTKSHQFTPAALVLQVPLCHSGQGEKPSARDLQSIHTNPADVKINSTFTWMLAFLAGSQTYHIEFPCVSLPLFALFASNWCCSWQPFNCMLRKGYKKVGLEDQRVLAILFQPFEMRRHNFPDAVLSLSEPVICFFSVIVSFPTPYQYFIWRFTKMRIPHWSSLIIHVISDFSMKSTIQKFVDPPVFSDSGPARRSNVWRRRAADYRWEADF